MKLDKFAGRMPTLFDRVVFLEEQMIKLQEIVIRQSNAISNLQVNAPEISLEAYRAPDDHTQTMMEICHAVAKANGVSVQSLRGHSRKQEIAWLRQLAMKRMAMAGASQTKIGRFLGGRDHSTVGSGIKAHDAREKARMGNGEGQPG